jgi:hypothetical protein
LLTKEIIKPNSVIVTLTASSLKPREYRILIPPEGRYLFPNCYAKIELQTDDIDVMERHYNPKFHELSIGKWLRVHPELKPGDKLIIEVIEPMKRYRLKIA